LTGWLIAAYATDNPRDCRLVTLASILPDADGLGLLVDGVNHLLGHPQTHFYVRYHHFLLHGLFGAMLLTLVFAALARKRGRVALLCVLVYHLHLVCDLVGSRGPAPEDLWPIFYFGPFDKDPMWLWKHQWRLDGWQNRYFSVAIFFWALLLAELKGHSVVGVFNRRLDAVFVSVLRKWRLDLIRLAQRRL